MTSLISSAAGAVVSAFRAVTFLIVGALGGVLGQLLQPAARALALAFFVAAAVAFASDMGTTLTGGPAAIHATPAITHWQMVSPMSLKQTRAWFEKRTKPWVWTAASAPLSLPTSVLFMVLGAAAGYLGRHRRRVEIFIN